ncbi:MAG: guanylate kinase [Pleurocapsa sp. SU_5_0]|nr:guanylate kinase [Pleurocapsa sp. SU_5_0]NJR45149.1 guanylate kinase [Hyellaceae cyanobacterium CSU_1_1]
MSVEQPGKLIVITGPSGVGKGTLVSLLLQRHPQLSLSVSATTREPRPGEIDGVAYYFLNQQDFETAIFNHELLEWAEYAGNYYGTPKAQVIEQIEQGNYVVLEIELAGARAIANIFPQARRIFILPPSIEELEARIRARGTNSEESIANRLAIARQEIAASEEFDFAIVNDEVEVAIAKLENAIFS